MPKIFKLISVLFLFSQIFTFPVGLAAYEFSHYVMDARTGKFLYGKNFEKKLHPASLTKMMTLYLIFNELQHKRMKLDDLVTISQNAASEPSSKLWLATGQRVSLRTLIRGAAIRSANDAATALGEHISGSEAKFADYMTLSARKMGMSKTTFKNAHGLTSPNHLSTPEDMAILARRLIFDFPEYYNLFGRQSVSALGKTLYNTNRRFLGAYRGSDGIKTGFTSLAGYNLAASASRGDIRVIGVIFGAGSVALRNKRMTELLDLGFANASQGTNVIPLSSIDLIPDLINKAGRNSLLSFSAIPVRRPNFLRSTAETGYEVSAQEIEKILESVEETLIMESASNLNLPGASILKEFNNSIKRPPSRPNLLLGEQIVSGVDTENQLGNRLKTKILVGFYYSKYNAEKDLPSILLSDSSLLKNVSTEISKEVFRDKIGFRIKIYPLSELNASRACAKIRSTGEICDTVE